jgi:hypothetical protein
LSGCMIAHTAASSSSAADDSTRTLTQPCEVAAGRDL